MMMMKMTNNSEENITEEKNTEENTAFTQLKALCKQFINLAKEIDYMVDKEEFNAALSRIEGKDNLINKYHLAKKVTKLSPAEQEEINALEQKIVEYEKSNIEKFEQIKDSALLDLIKTNKNLKVNQAYTSRYFSEENQGSILDFTE